MRLKYITGYLMALQALMPLLNSSMILVMSVPGTHKSLPTALVKTAFRCPLGSHLLLPGSRLTEWGTNAWRTPGWKPEAPPSSEGRQWSLERRDTREPVLPQHCTHPTMGQMESALDLALTKTWV